MNNTIQSLWIGSALSKLEQLCLKSFIDNDMEFHLYTYDKIDNIPEGIIIKNGNEILDKSEIFRYNNGSVSAFSNLFRFTLLDKKGGFWVDTDVICVRPFSFEDEIVIMSEPEHTAYEQTFITSSVIRLPKDSEITKEAVKIQREHKGKILTGEITWGSGPLCVKTIVKKFNLEKYVKPWNTICSCSAPHVHTIVIPNRKPHPSIIDNIKDIPENMVAIHLWNEVLRRSSIDKDQNFHPDSLIEYYKRKHLTKLNILYLCDKRTYFTKMSRVRFHGIKALSEVANIHYSGLGWEDYNNDLTVQENINNMNRNFDICIVYKPLDLNSFKDITIPKCIRYNEMYDLDWTLKEIKESGSQLVICHHLNDCEQYQKMNIPDVKFVYIGHCAEKRIFKNYNLKKEYDILIAGCISPHYPLRNKFIKIFPILNQKYRCHIHPHPGYNFQDAHTDIYLKEMAIKINKSRITLTDTGLPRSRYGKYIEIPMCGTSAICGDLPDDNADDYNYVIEVTNDMSDKEIIDKISYYLDNEEKRLEKVNMGIEFANNYTQENYAKRLLKEINRFII